MKNSSLLLLASLCIAPLAGAASFDCAKARSAHEKMICADKELSALDDSLATTYKKATAQTPQSLRSTLRDWQQQWLESTEACKNANCLKTSYRAQIDNLSHITPAAAPSGEYKRYARGKLDTNGAGIDIIAMNNGKAYVSGNATWVGNASTGNVNAGDIGKVASLSNQRIHYVSADEYGRCDLTLALKPNALTVSGSSMACGWGLNVSFDGDYHKVK